MLKSHLHTRVFVFITFFLGLLLSFFIFFELTLKITVFILPVIFILFLLLLYPILDFHIRRPLALIQHALNTENPVLVEKLISSKNELGQIALLVKRLYEQRELLLAEITERRGIEEILRESEERYRSVVETSPDMILVMDLNANVLLSNVRANVLFDPSGSVSSRNLINLVDVSEKEHFKEILEDLMERNRINDIECLMLKKGDIQFNAEISLSLMKGAKGDPHSIMAIIKDISDRKNAEMEKAKIEEQFRAVYKMEAIGQLAGGIAHDFNNILGAISGYADIIRNRYTDDDKLSKYSGMIVSAATRAAELTSKLLTFARKSKLQMVAFNIHDILLDLRDLLEHTIDKKVTIVTEFSAEESVIIGDSSQFQSSVMNLAINARDAMPDGGTLLIKTGNRNIDNEFAKVHTYTVAPGYYVYISVKDTGTGMDKQTLAHMFEPFFTTKGIGKGTGLGLASVYGTVKSHSGYVDVESVVGEGSTFTLYFPVSRQIPGVADNQPNVMHKGKGHILVVDDESFMRDAVKEMLTWLGYEVTTASNGNEAIEVVQGHTIDLIILDMVMPGMNGRECYRKVKKISAATKAMLSTGYRVDEERQAILNEGFVAIIQKPFVSAQLAQAVYDALQGKPQRR